MPILSHYHYIIIYAFVLSPTQIIAWILSPLNLSLLPCLLSKLFTFLPWLPTHGDSLLSQVDEEDGGSQTNQLAHVHVELFLKTSNVSTPLDSIDDDKALGHLTDGIDMDIATLDYNLASCSNDNDLCLAIGTFLHPNHEFPIPTMVLEHSDRLPVFVPTFSGSAGEVNEDLLLGSFHLEL